MKKVITILFFLSATMIIAGLVLMTNNTSSSSLSPTSINTSTTGRVASIEQQTILDNEYAKVDLVSLTKDKYINRYTLKYRLENKYQGLIEPHISIGYINDIQKHKSFDIHGKLKEKESYEGEIAIYELDLINVDEILDFDIKVDLFEEGGDFLYKGNFIKVTTNLAKDGNQKLKFGDIIYSDDKIDVQYVGIVDADDYADENYRELMMFFYNKSDKEVNLWTTDLYIDEISYGNSFNISIDPHKYAFNGIFFYTAHSSHPVEEMKKAKFAFRYFECLNYLSNCNDTSRTNDIEFDVQVDKK